MIENRRLLQSVTPEWRFILASARLHPDSFAVCSAADAVTSWDQVLVLARRHHLAPLVSRTTRACPDAAVPESVRLELDRDRQKSAALNTMYLRQGGEVLRAFKERGLSPVVLKGFVLAENLYGDAGLRPFCDLDVLFARDEIERAETVLAELRYEAEPSPHGRDWYFQNYYQLPRHSRRPSRFCVELHWDLARRPNPFRVDVDSMRRRAVATRAAGVPVLQFTPEDRLLHLCVHLAWGNGFDAHLRGVVDIAETLRAEIDWEVFEQRAIAANAAQVSVAAIELAVWLLDAPVHGNVFRRLQRFRGGVLARYVTSIGQARALSGGDGHRTLMRLFWMEHMSQRVRLLQTNFGAVAYEQFDRRPQLFKRVLGGLRRAMAPFSQHG
jgi:hypothetical protein